MRCAFPPYDLGRLADLTKLIDSGKSDVQLIRIKWRCAACGSRLTGWVAEGSHQTPGKR